MSSAAASDTGISYVSIPCPHCGQPSTNIKSLRAGVLVFLGVGGFWRTWIETGCAACVRGKLLKSTALNLLTAHVMWPIAVLPLMTVQLLRTVLEGHSPEILRQLGLPTPPPAPLWIQLRSQFPVAFRVLGIVQILMGTLLLAGITFLLGDTWFRTRGIELLISGALVAVVGVPASYMFYSGLSKVIGLAPPLWLRIGVAVLSGAMLVLASPWLARLAWRQREQALFTAAAVGDASDVDNYVRKVPAALWRPEPVERYVAFRIAQLQKEATVWADHDLGNVKYSLEIHHAGDPEFTAIGSRIEAALRAPSAPAAVVPIVAPNARPNSPAIPLDPFDK